MIKRNNNGRNGGSERRGGSGGHEEKDSDVRCEHSDWVCVNGNRLAENSIER